MLSERSSAYWQQAKWVEGLVLLLTAPFLLFPERFILLTFISLALLATIWFAPILLARSPLIPPTPFNTALLFFCLTVFVGILVTANPELTLSKTTGLILGLGVWRYLVIAIQQRSGVDWAIAGYLVFGLGFIIVGLLNANWLLKAASQVPAFGQWLASSPAPSSFLNGNTGIHPNQIAGTITLVLPLLIAILIGRTDSQRRIRWLVALAAIFCGLALLFTQSRSGWAGLLGGLFLMLVVWAAIIDPSKQSRIMRIIAGLLISLGLILLIAMGPQRLQQLWLEPPVETAVGSFSTLNFRRDVWPWAIQAINDFPVTGIGLGTFRQAALELYPVPVNPNSDIAHAHNMFLQVTVDLGIPGLIAYSAILILCGVVAWKISKSDMLFRSYSIGLLASLFAYHIYGLADALALGSKPAVLFWAIPALLAVMIRLR